MGLLALIEMLFAQREVVVGKNGTKYWYYNEKLHREDGPAIEYANGGYEWYLNGEPHRIGGPSAVFANGDKFWNQNGEFHREDGPACEYSNGDVAWFLNGKMVKSNCEYDFKPKVKHNWSTEGF